MSEVICPLCFIHVPLLSHIYRFAVSDGEHQEMTVIENGKVIHSCELSLRPSPSQPTCHLKPPWSYRAPWRHVPVR